MIQFKELPKVRQIEGEPARRWFDARGAELIVWLNEAREPFGFQLCRDVAGGEYALTWRAGGGYSHARIDGGDRHPNPHKGSPILLAAGAPDIAAFRELFDEAGLSLPLEVRELVGAALCSYPQPPAVSVMASPRPRREEAAP